MHAQGVVKERKSFWESKTFRSSNGNLIQGANFGQQSDNKLPEMARTRNQTRETTLTPVATADVKVTQAVVPLRDTTNGAMRTRTKFDDHGEVCPSEDGGHVNG